MTAQSSTCSHEGYLKGLLSALNLDRLSFIEAETRVPSFEVHRVIPDAVFGVDWVVELEARTTKQVRGVITDLMIHPRRKKMLIVLVEPTQSSSRTAQSVEAHLYQVVSRLGLNLDDWCIIGLSRNQARDEHLSILEERFIKEGILLAEAC